MNKYTNFEIIFWYSALIITIFIFVLFLKSGGTNKKLLRKDKANIEKNIYQINIQIDNNLNVKNKLLFDLSRTLRHLNILLNNIKETTKLDNVIKSIEHISEINKIIRRHYNLDDKVYLSNLIEMKKHLENLIEELDAIILLIRV